MELEETGWPAWGLSRSDHKPGLSSFTFLSSRLTGDTCAGDTLSCFYKRCPLKSFPPLNNKGRLVSTNVIQRISEHQGNIFHEDGKEEKLSLKKKKNGTDRPAIVSG